MPMNWWTDLMIKVFRVNYVSFMTKSDHRSFRALGLFFVKSERHSTHLIQKRHLGFFKA